MEVAMLRESQSKTALQYFEAVLSANNRHIEALLGKVGLVVLFLKIIKFKYLCKYIYIH